MLADITISTEAMVVISAIVVSLTGAVTYLFTTIISNYDKQLEFLKSDKKSWQEMAQELGINIEKAVNRKRALEGLPPFRNLEPIVPEHSSPVTVQQQSTADIGTMRARLVAAAKELNLPPRLAPPPANDESADALEKSINSHATVAAELSKATAADAISDAKGAIKVADVAIDAAGDAIKPDEASK